MTETLKKVYICSSLRPEVYVRVTELLNTKCPKAIHLRPYLEQTGNKLGHIECDVAMIHHCDELWVVGEYGRDCAWEIGYATAMGKPIKVFKDASNALSLEKDWMLYHGLIKGTLEVVDLTD